jgi:hypothetical protein
VKAYKPIYSKSYVSSGYRCCRRETERGLGMVVGIGRDLVQGLVECCRTTQGKMSRVVQVVARGCDIARLEVVGLVGA